MFVDLNLSYRSEARVASYVGQGFYTIGPCGEELLGTMALNLKPQDLTALHYRHLAMSVNRQTMYDNRTLADIALDRARGFAVSSLDPITGGRHCSIGGNPQREFLVTSTLASQVPPAVGRALAIPLSQRLLDLENRVFAPDALSIVSVGDGSINNAHFLAGLNLARYAAHNNVKCPSVFIVSDNNICISLKGTGYTNRFVSQLEGTMTVEKANGQDVIDLYEKSQKVFDYARKTSRPALLYIHSLPRRFGHAATDRQFAYYSAAEIQKQMDQDPLSDTISQLLRIGVYANEDEVKEIFHRQRTMIEQAFDQATQEPKITDRKTLQVSAPLPPSTTKDASVIAVTDVTQSRVGSRGEVMRKNMTRVFDELMTEDKRIVYLGEDVQHGGYYVVTENLFQKFPLRVRDFPPDETTLVGAAMGYAQAGFVPILEIPYAKYLDCAGDMFTEAMISYWLSQGKQPNGFVIRLQGFDKGIFGGNFHTHNMLHFPPGLDVVCFSNGRDYARGMRYLMDCAKAGRVVMSVDSTDLLNRRHLVEADKDEFFLHPYPVNKDDGEGYHFDQVFVYDSGEAKAAATTSTAAASSSSATQKHVILVTYGNGVPTAVSAGRQLAASGQADRFTVIDVPCLTQTPAQLVSYFESLAVASAAGGTKTQTTVVFADVCKKNAGMPMSLRALDLHEQGLLSGPWTVIGAENTYNPLGTYLTFLSVDDIVSTVTRLQQ